MASWRSTARWRALQRAAAGFSRQAGEDRRRTEVHRCTLKRAPLLLAVVLLGSCGSRVDLPTLGAVPAFTLTDQNGATFESAGKLGGEVWVADFMFTTCPGPCPLMSSQMHQVQKALETEGIRLVSFTVDPDHDTPAVLLEYGERFKASPGVWHFLTGSRADLHHLSKDVFKLGDVDGTLEHSTRFVLIDRHSQIRGYYLTSEPDAISRVIEDARALLKERS